jgi:decaprenylphospho-beta-D-erythro-pentofuranosid-2-ulose 2-reductase
MPRIVIVGATSLIAEHCARQWLARSPVDLVLLGRDAAKLERIAADLRVRSPSSQLQCLTSDFLDAGVIAAVMTEVFAKAPADIVLIAHGALPHQAICQSDLLATEQSLKLNAISPALFAEACAGHMQEAGRGTLAIIGSVAGDRGRAANYIYGAAKGLLWHYAQGLQQRLANTDVKVVFIKPGPTATPMTAHIAAASMAKPEDVARLVLRGVDRGRTVVYAPAKWWLVMMVVRHLPEFVFNRMKF